MALRVEERRTSRKLLVNAGVATVEKNSMDKGIALYMSSAHLLQDDLDDSGVRE